MRLETSRTRRFEMCRLNKIGRDTVNAVVVLLALLGFGLPAVAAPVGGSTSVNANENDLPTVLDVSTLFTGGVNPQIYGFVSNDNAGLVTPLLVGSTLTLTYSPGASGTATVVVDDTDAFGNST